SALSAGRDVRWWLECIDCRSSMLPCGLSASASDLHGEAAWFFFSSRRRHTRSVSAFLLNRSSDLIEACGISTLSQSPMLGFHKQMDNRIKLLEEILSFRMQGVEFDNGDMYVDGHKAASDVRDEFVSVTEKL